MHRVKYSRIFLILIISSFLLLTACGGNEQTAEELMRYHNEMWTEFADQRDEILKGNMSQLSYIEKTEGNQGALNFLEEIVLSEFEDFIKDEKAIKINDASVKELHELLIEADEFFYNFIKEKASAYYLGEIDEDEVLEANEEVKESYQTFFDYRGKLMGQNKLVIDHVRNEKGSYELRMIPRSEAKNLDGIKWGEP